MSHVFVFVFDICDGVFDLMKICCISPVHAVHGDYNLVETVANIRPVTSEIKIQRKCSCIIMVLLFDIIDVHCYETGRCIIDWDV